jgi:RHS repeat-associated protein
MQNQTTGGSQRYGYDMSIAHLLTAAVRSNGNSLVMQPGSLNTAYIQRDLGGPAQFGGTITNNTLAAGATDLLAFRFDQSELSSSATGTVLLRVQVQGTDGTFVPATPTIAGLQPREVNARGNLVVALFAIDKPGLYVVAVSGATSTTAGSYALNLTVAGDLNGDGNVDGNDSALFAAALGSIAGASNYSLAADINGDGKVDDADQVILASDYGFHAATAVVPTAPPTQPAFDLDVNSAVGDGMTADASVTLVGRTDPNLTVTLQPTGAVTKANPNGLFAFFNVPLADGGNAFTAIATSAGGVTSQFTKVITRTQPGLSLTPPVVSAHLADDTGVSSLDNITSDDTITGSITAANPIASLEAEVDQSAVADVLSTLSGTTFTISPALLATINGGALADGKHVLTLIAKDSNGNLSQPVAVSFILITAPPAPVTPKLLASSDTGISNSDGITRVTTPTFRIDAPAGAIVRLYVDRTEAGHATAKNGPVFITTTTLAAGTHQITATAEDIAGNVSTAAAPVPIVIQTTPPAAPTLGLDAASQSAPGQATVTDKDIVNLTGKTDAGAYVTLYRAFDLNTPIRKTQADASGNFTFSNVALAAGTQAFTVVASDAAANSSQTTQTITTLAADTAAPVITAGLANDTGISSTDGITYDPTITGVVDDPSGTASFHAALDGGSTVNVTALVTGVGFTFTAADLATLSGGTPLADGPHTLSLQATDNLGHASAVVQVSFTLQTARPLPPANLHLIASDLTGTSNTITKARSLTVELTAPSGTLVTLYMNGTSVGQQTAQALGVLDFAVPGMLADGQYLFTATAGTVSGLVSPFSTPFTVTVDNTPPAITSFGLDALSDARPYGHNLTQMAVVGLTGQTVPGATVELVETGAETTADSSGNFAFYPVNLPNLAAYTFTAQVTDVAGNSSSLQKTFTRIDNTLPSNLLPPDVTLILSQNTARVGDTVTFTITTQSHDGQPLASEVLLLNGKTIPLSSAGTATFTSATPGVFTATAKAFDAEGNEGDATRTLTFLTPPNGLPAPVAGFNETVVTPVVTMPTPIMGTANTPDLLQYTLSYAVEGQNNFTQFASGTTPVINGTLGRIDPTMMQNGFYDVRLTVEDTSGQVTKADEVYQVDGQAKLGNFTLSYTDVNIPMPGLPLTATRTYDSRTREIQGDFGYGWTLGVSNVRVETSSVLGAGFIQTQTQLPPTQIDPLGGLGSLAGLGGLGGGLFGGLPGLGLPPGLGSRPAEIQYAFQNTNNDYVTIYLPDGSKEQFIMGFTGITYTFAGPPLASTSIFFVPIPGTDTTGTLEALTDNDVIVSPARVGPVTFIDRSTGQVYNPTRWQYTSASGTVYVINSGSGLESVTDPDGNTLTYSTGKIGHSSGLALSIARDSQGRVTSIADPLGGTIRYAYDFYGDLVTVTDQQGDVTTFTYNTDHYLLEEYNALGERGARNEYDASGRMIATVDAAGNRVTYSPDLPGHMEVQTDQLGHVTVTTYDDQGNVLTTTDPLGNLTSNTYDTNGNKLSTTDPLGNTTRYTYDAAGNRTSETDPTGAISRWTYNSLGEVLTTTDPMGNVTTNTYDATGTLLSTTDALGDTTSFTYDSRGDETSITDPLGNVTAFVYDAYGHKVEEIDPLGNVQHYTYDLMGNIRESINTRANVNGAAMTVTVSYTYDAVGRVLTTTDTNGDVIQNVYDATGDVIKRVHSDGAVTTYQFDVLGLVAQTTLANGTAIGDSYDALGKLTSETDPAGNATLYIYDADGRLIKQIFPDGTSQTTTYDADGRAIAVTDTQGNVETYTYGNSTSSSGSAGGTNGIGRLMAATDALGNTTQYSYDANGNRLSEITPSGQTVKYIYDKLNRNTQIIAPDGTSTSVVFDADGRKTATINAQGGITQTRYDANGRVIEVIDPLGNTTSYTYDSEGNMLTLTDANGHVTRFDYDDGGRLIQVTLPMGMSKTYTYNTDSTLKSETDYNGQVTTYTYDTLGRMASITGPDGSETFTYTAAGNRSSVSNASGVASYTYDTSGRILKVSSPDGSAVTYTYDAAGRESSVTSLAGTTTYTYDALGRLLTVTDPDGGVTSYTYDASGNVATVSYPNHNKTAYQYNLMDRIVSETQTGPNGSILASYEYQYDQNGLVTQVTEATGRVVSYTYDADQRLVVEKIHDPSSGDQEFAYTYDAVGNRLTKSDSRGGVTIYQYDTNDRLIVAGNASFTYDNNGNMLSETSGGQTTTYTYNSANRLVMVAGPDGIVTYAYDVDGNRVKTVQNGTSTRYIVDTNVQLSEVLATVDSHRKVTSSFVYGAAGVISQETAGARSYYLTDAQSSVRLLSDASGRVTDTFTYDAFGNLLAQAGTTTVPFLFTGNMLDSTLGLYYLRARYYNPVLGRFLTADPAGGSPADPATLNKYNYARQDPANFEDPSGNAPAPSFTPPLFLAFESGPWAIGSVILDFAVDIMSLAYQIAGLKLWFRRAAHVPSGSQPSFILGIDGSFGWNISLGLEGPWFGSSFSVGGSLELLYIPSSKTWTAFTSWGVGIGLSIGPFGSRGTFLTPSFGITPEVGGVLGISTPKDYQGPYITTSISAGVGGFFDIAGNVAHSKLVTQAFGVVPFTARFVKGYRPVTVNFFSSYRPGSVGASVGYGTFNGAGLVSSKTLDFVTSTRQYTQYGQGSNNPLSALGDLVLGHVAPGQTSLQKDFGPSFGFAFQELFGGFFGSPLALNAAASNPAQPTRPLLPSNTISDSDPRLTQAIGQAESLWQAAVGHSVPLNFSLQVVNLPAGELGETRVETWDAQGNPTAATILLSPNGTGTGWFIDSSPSSSSPFLAPVSPSSELAPAGSDASGRYDLLTTILHEIGHIEGFMPSDPAFEHLVRTVGGSQMLVSPTVSVRLVNQDQELDPALYPGDLLSATLAPGVRELPSALDVQILDAVNNLSAPSPPLRVVSPPTVSSPIVSPPVGSSAATTTILDHALGSLGDTSPASDPVETGKSRHTPGKSAAHHNGDPVTRKSKHAGAAHDRKPASRRVMTQAHHENGGKPALRTPNATMAMQFSRAGLAAPSKSAPSLGIRPLASHQTVIRKSLK